MNFYPQVKNFTDRELAARLLELATDERRSHVELLVYLGEMDDRKLYLGQGYSSMWDYSRRALGFSESVSQQRIVVARAARRFPVILEMVGDGRLTLCTAADLAPALNEGNSGELLTLAAGKSRKEVLDLKGGVKHVERDVIRRLEPKALLAEPTKGALIASEPKPGLPPSKPVRHRVAFTASDSVVSKLEKLQSLLGDVSLEEVIDRAADRMLNEVDPTRREARREARKVPQKPKGSVSVRPTEPRRPPTRLRDRVFVDAGQRCSFRSSDGVRCTETRFLSIDHVRPYALGGTSTDQSNLRCLCMAHNLYLGRQTFRGHVSLSR